MKTQLLLSAVIASICANPVLANERSTFDPATHIVDIPQLFIKNDPSQTSFHVGMKYLGGTACEVAWITPNANACYEPTPAQGEFKGEWDINERHNYQFTVPNDAGGGYARVILVTSDPNTIPWLTIKPNNDPGAIFSGSSAQLANEQRRDVIFEAYPGQTYFLEVSPFFNGNAPMPYTLTWEFFSRVDCYEPNNGKTPDIARATAKSIPLNQTIEAYAIAGFREYYIESRGEQTSDWYRIDLDQPATIKLEQIHSPSNIKARFRLFDAQNRNIRMNVEGVAQGINEDTFGRLVKYESVTLDAGSYLIETTFDVDRVNASANIPGRKADLSKGEQIPDHFNTLYKFTVLSQ
ncbi:hypothetical protein [Nitrosomonas halophila]|uniref:F5/8 type C domain-containing protein n=1 Tax=Nitrosomonas halophila TaxID=44576 RepID=A0A1H3PN09_9PROT|nr:hypothetical protein [Nitrosomonas halophila]SDZ02406.1 hypothetical protein SAMN05421881_11043 [Nitrosomonas halophila]HRQ05068.1 hypothetical protein [Nitrosomonas halophila]